jgi:S-adenosylmethionine:tRNA ribosyltransferase-isomerase
VRATELDYELPEELIAQEPPAERDAARLLVVGEVFRHETVRALPSLVRPALWVVNDTRVISARLLGARESGGRVELLLLALEGPRGERERWTAMGRASKPLRPGTKITFDGLEATILARGDDGTLQVELASPSGVEAAIERIGHVPLPPYIRRPDDERDRARYQTIFADRPGAIAAPTAGLHFTPELLEALASAGHTVARVTLHVGAVKVDDLDAHEMHEERFEIGDSAAKQIEDARREGRPIVAVGTTVVRALESRAQGVRDRTSLFIRPPYTFRAIDALLTNFHLPRSTLLALVMAFGGVDRVRRAYEEAVRARYRFFSYGDAMLLGTDGVWRDRASE